MKITKLAYLAVLPLLVSAAQSAPAKSKARPKAAPKITKPAANSVAARRQMAIGYVKRAAVAYERRDYKAVIALCKTANNLAPTYARAYAWAGAAQQKLGNYREARFNYRWVVALAPNTPDAARAKRGLKEVGG